MAIIAIFALSVKPNEERVGVTETSGTCAGEVLKPQSLLPTGEAVPLRPENSAVEPIVARDVRNVGKVGG